MEANTVLSNCTGGRLMLACLETGSEVITLLAQGERSDVIFDTGNTQDLHVANGVGWYFNDSGLDSWGFVRAGDTVSKNNCDTDASGANDERLCWHLNDDGGYRCGANIDLNFSTAFQRIVLQPAGERSSIPTLSEWGLIAMAGFMGIAGLLVMRRRKLTA
ncbi:MAG: IPTL-CTERM sorting domain-containing protein [Candidatus Dadabacteria bacterium]